MAYAEMTQRAAASGQRVVYYRCSSEKTLCIKYLMFREGRAGPAPTCGLTGVRDSLSGTACGSRGDLNVRFTTNASP